MTQPSRDLIERFTAAYPGKKKLCLGMRSQRKCPLLDLNVIVVQYFLPDADNTNLTFYQQVLTGEKKCLSLDSVHPEVVPTFPEITVKNLYAALQKDPKTLEFIPDQASGKKLKLQKSFLWTLICTLRPEWAKALVKACVDSRNKLCQDELASRKMIPISAEVIQKLLDCDFVHCKCISICYSFFRSISIDEDQSDGPHRRSHPQASDEKAQLPACVRRGHGLQFSKVVRRLDCPQALQVGAAATSRLAKEACD